ncbi:MAG: glycosyltransferase family 4 protein [Bacteroidota bacterium]
MHIVQSLSHSNAGGGQEIVFTLVKTLLKTHTDITFSIILPAGGRYNEKFKRIGVSVIAMPFDRISLFTLFHSYTVFKKLKPDVIHSQGKGAGYYSRFLSSRMISAVRIHTYHGFHPPINGLKRILYNILERLLLLHTRDIISVSQGERQEIGDDYPSVKDKIKLIPNCVDREDVICRSNEDLPEKVSLFFYNQKNTFKIVMIGRDDPVKNYPLAFKAAKMTLGMGIGVSFVFIGIKEHSEEYKEVKNKFPDFVLGVQSLDNVLPVIKNSDALLITSRKEGSPLVILEAFCLGKPVIGTDVPGIKDLINPGENGILCHESPAAISTAIDKLSKDHSLYRDLSDGARATASRMDVNTWAEKYYTIYKGNV